MSYTVWGAFDSFRSNTVDLNSNISKTARSSRDYLFEQIKKLAAQDNCFPNILSYIAFGSFARKTRIRPLADIDIMPIMNGNRTSCLNSYIPYVYLLKIVDRYAPLANFDDGYGCVNSTKVLNRLKTLLSSVPNYRKAELKKNMQAVTLNLISYTWVFDIVPSVILLDVYGNISCYLIPDGKGNWIKTDPSIDQINITRVNQQNSNKFIPTLRLLKYWNKRTHKPVLPSYYFETIAIKTFDYSSTIGSYQSAINFFFKNCTTYLWNPCQDPKNLGHNLDSDVSYDTKRKVADAIEEAKKFSDYALMYENQNPPDYKNAIYWWCRVFGSEFPEYG